MEAVLEKLLAAAAAAGGKVNYPDFIESLTYQEQQLMPRVIRLGKANGTLKSYLVFDKESKSNVHILERVTP